MPTDGAYSPPFDEQAALAELQRLRDAIEESRRQRSQRSDEFEAFVRSFRTPSTSSSPGADAVQRPQEKDRQPLPLPVEQRIPVEQPVPIEEQESIEQPTAAEQPAPPPVAPSVPPLKRRARSLLPRALGGSAILAASLVLLIRPWKAVRSDTAASPSSGGAATTASAPPTGTPAPAEAPAAAAAAPAVNAHALEAELNIQRRVWVRVLVDGQRTMERELPAGTRIPLQADHAIVIRAGDAGALRLTINGVDRGPLGKDSEIVTRTFTASR